MDAAILLKRLIDSENTDTTIYKAYKNAIDNSYQSPNEEFTKCIEGLKILSQTQYDFKVLANESKLFDLSRRDYRELCDMICFMLGDKIKDLCIKPIFTKPTQFEDYCPFVKNDIVIYSIKPLTPGFRIVNDDKETYHIIDSKLETTPYYEIYCHSIERIR